MALQPVFAAIAAAAALCSASPRPAQASASSSPISVPGVAPSNAGVPLDGFVSYSIEFSSFSDFAGNLSHPNTFSNNLLNNIGTLTGTKPYIRVGGNTQDFAIFNSSLDVASVGVFVPSVSLDYPSILTIGPAYFESYQTWPDTKFSHGFNLGKNSTEARLALLESAPYACKALGHGNFNAWELGNEVDLFRGRVRPSSWNEQDYVNESLNLTRALRAAMQGPCPGMTTDATYKYIGPSFAGTGGSGLKPIVTWEDGYDTDKNIKFISSHNYINGAERPGVTLQGTLMNHSNTVASISHQLNESQLLAGLPPNLNPNLPFIIGETNSLYKQGRAGLSNTFGAALWGVDFNLWCVANNIRRVHMHQGTNYRYQSWQPIETSITSKGTKAPYYGNIAVASFLGDHSNPSHVAKIVNLPLPNEQEAAYAAYIGDTLARIIVINMMEYNTTAENNFTDTYPRPSEQYTFQLAKNYDGIIKLQRLLANGSDAITGVTFDGYSYNYELDEGRPVLLNNVTRNERVNAGQDGRLSVSVPRSSAIILSFGY